MSVVSRVLAALTYSMTLSKVLCIASITLAVSSFLIPCSPIENDESLVPVSYLVVNGKRKKNSRGRRRRQAVNIFRHNPCGFLEHVFASVTLFVSIFAEIQLPSACLPKRKDRR